MKKLFLVLIVILFLPQTSFAQTNNTDGARSSKKINSIDQIKNKVASRVAELRLVEKRGIVGMVENADNNEIRLSDLNGKTRIIDVDELTKFSSQESDSYDISDISKGSKISVIGLYNKESERLLARFVNEISIPVFLSGVISDKNDEESSIKLKTEDDKQYDVDIEKTTKSFSFTNKDLEKIGFSEIETLKNIIVLGFTDPKNNNRISASKIIVFPNLPQNPKIIIDNKQNLKPSKTTSPSPTP
jgi:Rad3-related DNA helicase